MRQEFDLLNQNLCMKKLLTIFLMVVSCVTLMAQTDDTSLMQKAEYPIFFRIGNSKIDPMFRENAASLNGIMKLLEDQSIMVNKIVMVSTTSPEGSNKVNTSLAKKRSEAVTEYFKSRSTLMEGRIEISSQLFTWSDLADQIRDDNELPNREQVIYIMENTPAEKIPSVLKGLNRGNTYKYLEKKYLANMRSSGCLMVYYTSIERNRDFILSAIKSDPVLAEALSKGPDGIIQQTDYRKIYYPTFALKTNLLVPAGNIGMEIPLGNRFSLAGDFYSPWLLRKIDHKDCLQLQGADAELRYWFGKKHESGRENRPYRLVGHAIGLYAEAGQYDFELDYNGIQGEYMSAGLSYTYSLTGRKNIARWEFSLGIGYLYDQSYRYDVYTPGGKLMTRRSYQDVKGFFGPTKAEISFVLPLRSHYKVAKEVTK